MNGSSSIRIGVRDIIIALPDFALAGYFVVSWIAPYTFGEKTVSYLMLIMLMEFINVHSAGFMGSIIVGELPRMKKGLAIAGIGMFYTLFVGAFCLAFGETWPLAVFWAMTLNRMLSVLLGQAPAEREKDLLQLSWGAGAICYLLFAFITTVLPIPAFGISDEVIMRQEFSGGGLWIEEPQKVISFGFLYFTGIGLFELNSRKMLKQR